MIKTAITLGFAIALLAVNVFVCAQFGHLNSEIKSLKSDIQDLRKTTHEEITALKEKSTVTSVSAQRTVASLQEELRKARQAAAEQVGQAKIEATAHAEEIAKKLTAEIAAEQQRRDEQSKEQLKTELTKVREAATTVDSKINQVNSEVKSVRTEIAADKSRTENQAAELKRVIGELGVQSDRIATNKKELAVLKKLGERNYFEFQLDRQQENVKVADIRMTLKKTNTKRGRYTIELTTADRRFQRKDRNANEPIQFYVNKTRQPNELVVNELYELVVNDIKDDAISGYLSTPKIQVVKR